MCKPSYYGVLPAEVRYDRLIPPRAIIIYSEITALSNKEGYCWASNSYFAKLFELDVSTVSALINALKQKGYIKIFIDKKAGNKRRIYPQINNLPSNKDGNLEEDTLLEKTPIPLLAKTPIPLLAKTPIAIGENTHTPIGENANHNNTSINTKTTTTTKPPPPKPPSAIYTPSGGSGGDIYEFDMEFLVTAKLSDAQIKRIVDSGNWNHKEIQQYLDYFAYDVQKGNVGETIVGKAEMFTRVLAKGSPWEKSPKYIHPREEFKLIKKKRKYEEHIEKQAAAVEAAKAAQEVVFLPAFETWRAALTEEEQYQIALCQAGGVRIKREHKNNITQLLRNYYKTTSEGRSILVEK